MRLSPVACLLLVASCAAFGCKNTVLVNFGVVAPLRFIFEDIYVSKVVIIVINIHDDSNYIGCMYVSNIVHSGRCD